MAGDWIKIECVTPNKPEVFEIADIIGIDPDEALGKLIRVWVWADQQTIDGNAASVTKALLNRVTGCAKFTEAMIQVGWLVETDGKVTFTNFGRHNGKTAKTRALGRKRADAHRSCNDSVTLDGKKSNAASVTKALPEKRREEKSISKDKHIASDAAVAERDASPPPYNLIGSQFMAAFGGQVHLTDKRRAAIRQRWRDPWWRENWQRALEKASEVPFFHGQSQSGWKITFDFFLRSDSAVKIIEGNYGDNKTTGTNQNKNNNLTAAERREQLNADSFQYLRDAVAAQQQRTSSTGIGNAIPSSTGAALLIEEHGTAHTARG